MVFEFLESSHYPLWDQLSSLPLQWHATRPSSTEEAIQPELLLQRSEPSAISPQPSIATMVGLDESTIESYQKLVLGESRRVPGPNDGCCTICLSEYKTKDTIRCIPECAHCFHAECIDEWLSMNSTCPLCRNSPSHPSTVQVMASDPWLLVGLSIKHSTTNLGHKSSCCHCPFVTLQGLASTIWMAWMLNGFSTYYIAWIVIIIIIG